MLVGIAFWLWLDKMMRGILFYSVLGEVGAAHEVGGWHAFFACELDLVEVDVAIEDCNFEDFFAIANEGACGIGWCAEFF